MRNDDMNFPHDMIMFAPLLDEEFDDVDIVAEESVRVFPSRDDTTDWFK